MCNALEYDTPSARVHGGTEGAVPCPGELLIVLQGAFSAELLGRVLVFYVCLQGVFRCDTAP